VLTPLEPQLPPETPPNSEPLEIEPADTKPVEIKPVDTKPVEIKPVDTKPVDTKPVDTKPVDTKPVDTKPVDTKPVDTKPVDTEPVDTKPEEPVAKTGTIRVSGDALRVVFVDSSGATHTAGIVPAGSYTVKAAFSDGLPVTAGKVTVPAGGNVSISCSEAFAVCK
jgi:hypothetical protein